MCVCEATRKKNSSSSSGYVSDKLVSLLVHLLVMMGSRLCDVIPPMPALIPIAALRNTTVTNKQCNNNVTTVNCAPCVDQQRQHQHQIVVEEDNADVAANITTTTTTSSSDEEEGDDEDEDDDDNDGDNEIETNADVEVRCNMETDVRQPAGVGVAGGAARQHQRSRRPACQADVADAIAEQRIDAAPSGGDASRDRGDDGPQAPARRAAAAATAAARRQPEPRHHRKSDHRRHRSERLLLLQQQQQQLLQQQQHLLQQQEQQRRRRQQRRRQRTTSNSSTATSYSSNSASVTSGSSGSVCDERTRSTVQRQQQQQQQQQQTAAARVNPIFVWVRQEDTRIVDVRCEDYDKRNRILLTKTAHGWRAIPRTETLTTSLEETPVSNNNDKHEEQSATITTINRSIRKPRNRKSNKTKRCRPTVSTINEEPTAATPSAVETEKPRVTESPLAWTVPVNVESHLPSHTIPVPRHTSSPVSCNGDVSNSDDVRSVDASLVVDADSSGVSNDVHETEATSLTDSDSVNIAESHAPECCGAVVSDVISPLDNLLAVAELEFNQQQHREQEIDEAIDKKQNLIDDETEKLPETTDCDYNDEDDDNHLAMTDILERLEQSLQSPMEDEVDADAEIEINLNSAEDVEEDEDGVSNIYLDDERIDTLTSDHQCYEIQPIPEEDEIETEQEIESHEKQDEEIFNVELPTDLSVKPTTITLDISEDELPTDLSKHCKIKEAISHESEEIQEDDMQPTDLSIRKHSILSAALHIDTPRPPSQNSETIQSPQPSGIPAVPPSPDIYINNKSSNKSLFLESLLSSTSPKLALTPEVTITRNQKEPLDLGKSRKSASPTVTCSEEAKNGGEPVTKKIRMEDITLKNLLHVEKQKADLKHPSVVSSQKQSDVSQQANVESSRLLELLTSDPEPEPVTQLKQLLSHVDLNIPDPLLVPKDRLSSILSAPAREIPKLLTQRPELRLPEALAYPQLLQDPDILVITLAQLQTILQKQSQPIVALQEKTKEDKPVEKAAHKSQPQQQVEKPAKTDATLPHISTDFRRFQPPQQQQLRVGDVDAATTAAFNQMLWLPYLNHLEAAALASGNNTDFFKALNSVYPPQMTDLSLFGARHPISTLPVPNFQPMLPPIDYTNSLEMAMWQEAMLQANLQQQQQQLQQRPKLSYGNESTDRASMLKKYHQLGAGAPRSQSSARTSPISHSYYQQQQQQQQQQRLAHHFGYPLPGMRPNLQIPQYNPVQQSAKRSVHKHNQFPQKYNSHHFAQQQHHSAQAQSQKSPRVTCKNLQNLLSPTVSKSQVLSKASNPLGVQPMDLSAPYPSTKMLKAKPNFFDPMTAAATASFNNKLWKHEDVPEVGSTTEEMTTSSHLHETQTHLWHPLFGK